MRSGVIFISMKTTTLILSPAQIEMLLNNLPQGHQITISVADLDRIIDANKTKPINSTQT